MITNFESVTEELTDLELLVLPSVISAFGKYTKENPIKAPEIIKRMNENFKSKGGKLRMSEPRLRKMCNYIRSNGLLPLISTSNGYYVSTSKKEIENQIKSLNQRASSILRSAEGLKKFI